MKISPGFTILLGLFIISVLLTSCFNSQKNTETDLNRRLNELEGLYKKIEVIETNVSFRLEFLYLEITKKPPNFSAIEKAIGEYNSVFQTESEFVGIFSQRFKTMNQILIQNKKIMSKKYFNTFSPRYSKVRVMGSKLREERDIRLEKALEVDKYLEEIIPPELLPVK